MRFRKLTKWEKPETSQALVFFAQIFEELLFNYSLSTYKPSAMNTSLLCEEARETIIEIEKGVIKPPNLDHILKELTQNLERDEVAKSLLDFQVPTLKAILLNPKTPITEKRTTIELLTRQLDLKNYKKRNEELLIETISGSCQLKTVRELSRSYATTLLNIGYTSEHIEKISRSFFYYDKNIIADNNAINEFIELFQEDPNEYIVIYRASNVFKAISNACINFKLSITENLEDIENDLSAFKFKLQEKECYIISSQIKARDANSAKTISNKRIETIGTLFNLFHHKESPIFNHECLIINKTKKEVKISKKEINTMHKCIDLPVEKAAPKMNKLISEFALEKFSFEKFHRSAELHALALRTESQENQMINLWISLESFIPAKDNDIQSSNIEHICNQVIPFINIYYFPKILHRLTSDLIVWNKRTFITHIKKIPGDGLVEKVARLLALSEHQKVREDLKSSFRDFHLLRERFEYLEDLFSSTSKIKSALDNHTLRVEWQIRRIYRARNLIVHSGKTPSYTSILIENIHEYLDCVFSLFIQLTTKPKKINNISQGFMYIRTFQDEILGILSKDNQPFDSELLTKIFKLNTFK